MSKQSAFYLAAFAVGVAALMAACAPKQGPGPGPISAAPPLPVPTPPPPPPPAPPMEVARALPPNAKVSDAASPREYRRDAASHLYGLNHDRIFKGKMPPLLYAVGVLDVDLDTQGQVAALTWRRAPTHAPEVMKEIERTIRAAAPFPVPVRLGKVTYTDIWLWHKSGLFQLDTLTEGQL